MGALAKLFDRGAPLEIVALFVDDDESLVPVLKLAVKQANRAMHGCQIVFEHAGTVDEGISKVLALQPDICFVDRMLPDGDGLAVVDVARQTHARFATLSAFSLSELGSGQLQAGRTAAGSDAAPIDEFKKQPDLLKTTFKNRLVNMALEQADAIRHRYRSDMSGGIYRIGRAVYVFGADEITLPNGRQRELTQYEREALSFFCTYPRATLRLDDLVARREMDARMGSRLFEVIVSGLNDKLEGFAKIEWEPTGGRRIHAPISILKLPEAVQTPAESA